MTNKNKTIIFLFRILRLVTLWFLLGGTYYTIEIVYRLIMQGGFPHWSMWIVGGICGIATGTLNQFPQFFRLSVRLQCIIGTVVTLIVEFVSGLVLNLNMQLNIWDYSDLPFNLMGQVCLLFGFAWLALMPFAIWLEDQLRWGFGWYGTKYTLWSIYKELFKCR